MLKLINTLIGMKLNFVHDKSEDGQLTYKIDPYVPPPSPFLPVLD